LTLNSNSSLDERVMQKILKHGSTTNVVGQTLNSFGCRANNPAIRHRLRSFPQIELQSSVKSVARTVASITIHNIRGRTYFSFDRKIYSPSSSGYWLLLNPKKPFPVTSPRLLLTEANKLRSLYFLVFCCTASWLPIFADYLKDRGLSGVQIGFVLSITPLMMFVVQPFYGMVADKFGYKRCLLVSSIFASISYALYFLDTGFVGLVLTTVMMSLFYNSLQPLLDSLSLRFAQRNPNFSYGTLRIAGAVGWAFTGIIAGHYIDAINTTIIFAISAISMLLLFVFSMSLASDEKFAPTSAKVALVGTKAILVNRQLVFLLLAVLLTSIGATTIWNFYSIYMKENGASASLVGYGLSFQGLCELPFFYFSARIILKLGLRSTLLVTVLATSVRLFLYSSVKNPQLAIAIELLHGLSWSLFWVACVEYVNLLVPENWRATGQSLLYAAYYGAGAIIGNLWTGFLYDSKMLMAEIFFLNGGIVFFVAVFVFFFVRKPIHLNS
jgi:MFS transporter, PPP family, 3-phenylpropionic acid transporter